MPPPPPLATISTRIPNVDMGYGVAGRDDGLSVVIGSNCCYFFGDTMLTQANAQASYWVVNSMYHTTNNNGDTGVSGGYNYLSNGVPPIQAIPYTPDEVAWNSTNAAKVVYGLVPCGQFFSPADGNQYITFEKTIEQNGGQTLVGTGLAICPTNPITGTVTRVESRPGNAQPYVMWDWTQGEWGHFCATTSNFVYFYWCNGNYYGCLYVARAPLLGSPPAFLAVTNWMYWNGSTWVTNNPSSAAYILANTGQGTVDWNAYLTNGSGGRGCYLFTYMSWVTNQICTLASSDLVHWSAPTVQYSVPVSWPSGYFPYNARLQKCLERNNGQTEFITWTMPCTNIPNQNIEMLKAQFPMVTPGFSGLTASPIAGYGTSNVTLTGTVSATGAYPAGGETIMVTIDENAQTTTVNDSTGDFSLNYNPSTLPASGTAYPITYSYAGDGALNSATNASTTLTVRQSGTSVAVSSSENPSGYGDSVNFAATLPPAATGSVIFMTNGVKFDTEALSGGLASSLTTASLPVGTNVITAEYAGDGNYLGSTNQLSGGQVVTNHTVVAVTAVISLSSNGVVNIRFVGAPNNFYIVQTATNVSGPWQAVGTNTAGSNGSWIFTNANATNVQQFYQAVPQP